MSKPAEKSDGQQMLDLVRLALGRSETVRPAPLDPFIEATVQEGSEELVARFTKEAMAVGGRVYRARYGGEAVARIAEICNGAGVGEVAVSGAKLLAEMNLSPQLAMRDLRVIADGDLDTDDREKMIAQLASCGAGVTAIDYAIAESGTIALTSDEKEALLVSLLPPIHIAVIHPGQIAGSLSEALGRLDSERMRREGPTRSATFITGPSRTGDVELTLSIGVHGPKELHLIILSE